MTPSSAAISGARMPADDRLRVQEIGLPVLRYGLALMIAWIGFIEELGQFLMKDVVLLGAAWSFGEASASRARIPV